MKDRERCHLRSVPQPSGSVEDSDPPEAKDPEPPDEEHCVILW
jgi:hypothetical protein